MPKPAFSRLPFPRNELSLADIDRRDELDAMLRRGEPLSLEAIAELRGLKARSYTPPVCPLDPPGAA